MSKLTAFNFITLNGYYKGSGEDISWHSHGAEESRFSEESLQAGNILLFGRVTYEMMAAFWPTEQAIQRMPVVAAGMNSAEKIVFSTTLDEVAWNNTTLVRGDIAGAVKALKRKSGKDITILGSGSIISQLAGLGLIDEYQFMIDPIALGQGTSAFAGIGHTLRLQLTATRTFSSGAVLLSYIPSGTE